MPTTTHPGSDAVAQGIVAQLEQNLPAQIAAINAEAATVADGFTLRDPIRSTPEGKLCWDWVPSPSELGQVPVIGLQFISSKRTDDNGFSFTGTYRHVIVVFDMDTETRGLSRRLRRWERAVESCFGPQRHLDDGSAYGVKLGGAAAGPTREHPENPQTWLSWTGVEIVASTDEQ